MHKQNFSLEGPVTLGRFDLELIRQHHAEELKPYTDEQIVAAYIHGVLDKFLVVDNFDIKEALEYLEDEAM